MNKTYKIYRITSDQYLRSEGVYLAETAEKAFDILLEERPELTPYRQYLIAIHRHELAHVFGQRVC